MCEFLKFFIEKMALKNFRKFRRVKLKFLGLSFSKKPARLLNSLELGLKFKNFKPVFLDTDI